MSTDGGTYDVAAQSIHSLFAAVCGNSVRCGLDPDVATCLAKEDATLTGGVPGGRNSPAALASGIRSGRIILDTSALPACIEGVQTPGSCDFNVLNNILWFAVPACRQAFSGTVAQGQPCVATAECHGGLNCIPAASDSVACQGVCAAAGVDCTQDDNCFEQDSCDGGTCVPRSPSSGSQWAACGPATPCNAGLVCMAASYGGTGWCDQPVMGTPCSSGADCGDGGLSCATDGGAGTCQKTPQPGSSCRWSAPRLDDSCGAGLICVPSDDLSTGTCAPPKMPGDPCTHLFECGGVSDLYFCDPATKTCSLKPTSGPCPGSGMAQQYSCSPATSYCDTSTNPAAPTCAPFKQPGASCTNGADDECHSEFGGTCDGDGGMGACGGALCRL